MAHYLVTAVPKEDKLEELRGKIQKKAFIGFEPFGRALSYSLENAKKSNDGRWKWEELDYCTPPLDQERKQVLDKYFSVEKIDPVEENKGWEQIDDLPAAL